LFGGRGEVEELRISGRAASMRPPSGGLIFKSLSEAGWPPRTCPPPILFSRSATGWFTARVKGYHLDRPTKALRIEHGGLQGRPTGVFTVDDLVGQGR